MNKTQIKRQITLFDRSSCTEEDYRNFLVTSYSLMRNYFAPDEDINSLELAHLIPEVPETMLAIYVGINDAVCNKGLVTSLLPQHGHNNVDQLKHTANLGYQTPDIGWPVRFSSAAMPSASRASASK